MRTFLQPFLVAAIVLAAGPPALAADGDGVRDDGLYGAATGALHFGDDVKFDSGVGSGDLDPSLGATIAVGREFRHGDGWDLRAEAELGYRRFETDRATLTDIPLMANGFVDVDLPTARNWRAYAGVGLGAVMAKGSGVTVGTSSVDDRNGLGLAWQAMAGVSYALDDRWTLFGGYRYFGTTRTKAFEVDNGVDTHDVKGAVHAHMLEIGVRHYF